MGGAVFFLADLIEPQFSCFPAWEQENQFADLGSALRVATDYEREGSTLCFTFEPSSSEVFARESQ
jgi:hypothetical protein